jgi:type II secretory pathway component PulK
MVCSEGHSRQILEARAYENMRKKERGNEIARAAFALFTHCIESDVEKEQTTKLFMQLTSIRKTFKLHWN